MTVIETERLILRTWTATDTPAFFRINQDPKVIEHLPGPMTMEEIYTFIRNCNRCFTEKQFCLFAAEEKETHELIGFIGLSIPRFEAHFTPAVEIGWRLGSQYWGKGYATEGARAVLDYGFNTIGLTEIVSFTIPTNTRSIRVMERLGMHRDSTDDFIRPEFPEGHLLSKHVLYRLKRGHD
jgi:RimJ/RimL family protein N-acetyltransferase